MARVPGREPGERRDSAGRQRFGGLLAAALKVRSMKQEDLAALLGTTQSSVSGWINGRYEPPASTVFSMERALAMEPGHLSHALGYLPLDAAPGQAGVEVVIAGTSRLEEEDKAVLISLYELLAAKRDRSTAPERAGTKAVADRAKRRAVAPDKRRQVGSARDETMAGGR